MSIFCEDCKDDGGNDAGDDSEQKREGGDESGFTRANGTWDGRVREENEHTSKWNKDIYEEPQAQQISVREKEEIFQAGEEDEINGLVDVSILYREEMLIHAAKHVKLAQVQCLLYFVLVH